MDIKNVVATRIKGWSTLTLLITAVIMAGLPCISDAISNAVLLGFTKSSVSETLPAGWHHISYPGKASNSILVTAEGTKTIVIMKSLHSKSALIRSVTEDLAKYPVLAWRWRVNRTVGMAIESQKDRNDCAARIRVIFGTKVNVEPLQSPVFDSFFKTLGFSLFSQEPSGYKIDYIWGNHAQQETILNYPGRKNHKMIVLERGNMKAGKWVWEERNLLNDFTALFGIDCPGITAVAVLSDTDHTNEGIEASFGSIALIPKNTKER